MKKILVLTAMFSLVASFAFADANKGIDFTNSIGKTLRGATSGAGASSTLLGKCSTGVGVAWYLDSTNGAGYALMTQHVSGTKAYGTSYDSTAVYITVTDVTPGVFAFGGGALGHTDTTDFTDAAWKKM
jgi:hypothetical protein